MEFVKSKYAWEFLWASSECEYNMVEISSDMCCILMYCIWTKSECSWWQFVAMDIKLGIILRFIQHNVLETGFVPNVNCEEDLLVHFGISRCPLMGEKEKV